MQHNNCCESEGGFVRKGLKVAGIIIAVIVVGGAIAGFVYTDGNLHAEERLISKARAAGIVEKQAIVDGHTINYGEGPDNGPALMLVHGQGMEWEDYASVLPELSKRYHVFAVDCFGHGESDHDPSLYSCAVNGDALITFAKEVIGGDYIVTGHSSGGVLAAYIASNDRANVIGLVLEDPPLFRVTPEEAQEGKGTFAWYDGYIVAHSFLQQTEVTAYPVLYAEHSYLFGLFGGLQKMLADQTAEFCAAHPNEHVTNAFVPRDWTRGMYFMNQYDPKFGDAFYDGTWMEGIDQAAMLKAIECPAVFVKATTNYGNDGVLYAATSDEDAQRVLDCVSECSFTKIDSGHDIHYEHPNAFVAAIDEVASQ